MLKHAKKPNRARRAWWFAGAAAVLGAVLVWWQSAPPPTIEAGLAKKPHQPAPATPPPVPATPAAETAKAKEPAMAATLAIVDLSAFAVVRGAESSGATAPRIRPIPQRMTLLLPMASEIGNYNIRLIDRNLKTARETRGKAALKDGRIVLTITLNANVSPGFYQLALQHEGEAWRLYPLEIKD